VLQNAIHVLASGLIAFALTVIVRLFRRNGSFGQWWDAEGLPIWILAWFGVMIFWFL
jgi:hypothetical protein